MPTFGSLVECLEAVPLFGSFALLVEERLKRLSHEKRRDPALRVPEFDWGVRVTDFRYMRVWWDLIFGDLILLTGLTSIVKGGQGVAKKGNCLQDMRCWRAVSIKSFSSLPVENEVTYGPMSGWRVDDIRHAPATLVLTTDAERKVNLAGMEHRFVLTSADVLVAKNRIAVASMSRSERQELEGRLEAAVREKAAEEEKNARHVEREKADAAEIRRLRGQLAAARVKLEDDLDDAVMIESRESSNPCKGDEIESGAGAVDTPAPSSSRRAGKSAMQPLNAPAAVDVVPDPSFGVIDESVVVAPSDEVGSQLPRLGRSVQTPARGRRRRIVSGYRGSKK
jgi:hypothetical protein